MRRIFSLLLAAVLAALPAYAQIWPVRPVAQLPLVGSWAIDGTGKAQANTFTGSLTTTLSTADTNDLAIIVVSYYTSSGLGSFTSSVATSGLTWALRGTRVLDSSGERALEVWYATATSPLSSASLTVSTTGTNPSEVTTYAFGVNNGLGIVPVWDSNASLPVTGKGTSNNPSVSGVSTTGSSDMVLGFVVAAGSSGIAAGSGFTLLSSPFDLPWTAVEYKVVTSPQSSISVGFTVFTSAWVLFGDALTT